MLCSIGYIWWPYAFLSNCLLVAPADPCMTFDPLMHYTLVWGSFCQIWRPQGISKEFDLWLTLADPCMTSDPAMSYTLIKGSSYQIWWPYGISKQFDLWLTLADPCMTFDPNNALRSGQGFFPPNLVAIGHLLSKLTPTWPQLTPIWPSTPAMHYALVRGSYHQMWWPYGIAKQFDPWLTPMTPAWHLTPALHYALVRGSSHQIW